MHNARCEAMHTIRTGQLQGPVREDVLSQHGVIAQGCGVAA